MSKVSPSLVAKFLQTQDFTPASKDAAIEAAREAGRLDVVASLEALPAQHVAALLGQVSPAEGSAPTKGSDWSAPAPGPLDLEGSVGRRAVALARRGLMQRRGAASGATDYVPLRAMTDRLGITHVRLVPQVAGRPIFGEQVVAHIDPKGNVEHTGSPGAFAAAPTSGTSRRFERVSPDMAQTLARGWFAAQMRPSGSLSVQGPSEPVWVRDPRPGPTLGTLRPAHHVQVHDFGATDTQGRPRAAAMNYLVDAETGDCLLEYNAVCGVHHRAEAVPSAAADRPRAVDSNVQASAEPGQIVAGSRRVSTSVVVDDPLELRSVVLDFGTAEDPGLRHSWRGDVVVEVESPSGTVARLAPFAENDDSDDVFGAFDLTETFAGELSPGRWKITVGDRYPAADDGDWRFVRLELGGRSTSISPIAVDTGPIDQTIPSGGSGVSSSQQIRANENEMVGRAFVTIELDSPAPEGVVARLSAPDGSEVDLGPVRDGPIPVTRALAGRPVAGRWTLTVAQPEGAGRDNTLRSWKLDLARTTPEQTPEDPEPPAPVRRDDQSPFTGTVQVPTRRRPDGRYELTDPSRGEGIETRNARRQNPNRVSGRFDRGVPFVSADDRWGGPDAGPAELSGMETQYFAAMTYDFLRDVFGFDSLDDTGRMIRALANVGIDYPNAFWFRDMFHVGTGDGRQSGRLSTGDIVAHELAHGVTEYSAGLLYTGESGGLNEATSDILGTGLEWYLSGRVADAPPFDWKIGEDTWTPFRSGDALRDMRAPRTDGVSLDHYEDYQRGTPVHFSSGIANRFFHLLVEGGVHRRGGRVDGLRQAFDGDFDAAMKAGLQVWFRALQYYMTPTTDFRGARDATLRAARDLFGDTPEVAENVASAWNAVGVKARPATRHAAARVA